MGAPVWAPSRSVDRGPWGWPILGPFGSGAGIPLALLGAARRILWSVPHLPPLTFLGHRGEVGPVAAVWHSRGDPVGRRIIGTPWGGVHPFNALTSLPQNRTVRKGAKDFEKKLTQRAG